MGRTSIKNKLILSFLALLFIVMVVVGVVNRITQDFYLAQSISSALAMIAGIIFGGVFSRSFIRRLNSLSNIAREISRATCPKTYRFYLKMNSVTLKKSFQPWWEI